jgi:hypothetical protein
MLLIVPNATCGIYGIANRNKMVSAVTARHFEEIQLRPKDFTQYLLGPEVCVTISIIIYLVLLHYHHQTAMCYTVSHHAHTPHTHAL